MSISAGVVLTPSTTMGVTDGTTAMTINFPPAATASLSVQLNLTTTISLAGTSGIAVDVTNPGSESLGVGVMFRDVELDSGSYYFRIGPARTETLFLRVDTWGVNTPAVYGIEFLPSPFPMMITGQPSTNTKQDLARTWRISFFMRGARTRTDSLIFDNLRIIPKVGTLDSLVAGMCDEYGQWSAKTWSGKVSSIAQLQERWLAEQEEQARLPILPDRDEFGAWNLSDDYGATGYFRKQKIDGKWWLIAPNGRKFFSTGISRIRPDAEVTIATGRETMFQYLPPLEGAPDSKHYSYVTTSLGPTKTGFAYNFHRLNMERKFGESFETEEQANLVRRLRSWGFNSLGRGVHSYYYRLGIPFVAQLSNVGSHPTFTLQSNDAPVADPYSPKFLTTVDTNVRQMLRAVPATESLMIGLVFGVEPPFRGRTTGSEYLLTTLVAKKTATGSPAKAEFVRQLIAKYTTIENLNASWGTAYASWDTVRAALVLPTTPTAGQLADMSYQVREYVRTYHRVVRDKVRELYPNHLFLGCSLSLFSDEVLQGASDYVDVHTFNYYRAKLNMTFDGLPKRDFDFLYERDLPAIISEFHFGAPDRGGIGPGIQWVATQEDRASSFTAYMDSVLAHPNFVGAWWFQYVDCPATGWYYDTINYAAGFVDITDTPYPEMVAAARALNGDVYNRRNAP